MKKISQIIPSLLLFIVLLACNNSENKSSVGNSVSKLSLAPPLETTAAAAVSEFAETSENNYTPTLDKEKYEETSIDRSEPDDVAPQANVASIKKIIKDGEIRIQSKDIKQSKKAIDEKLKQFHAYYENETLENDNLLISYELKIRIPNQNFESFLVELEKGNDDIKSKSVHTRDVTEEFVDIESRLANKREYLKRYKEILSKASTVKDIITLEENIRNLQEEIESKEGRLKYLLDQVDFSTLNLSLYQEKDYVHQPQHQDSFIERTKTSISEGWESVINFVIGFISMWPLLIILLVLSFIARKFIIQKRKKIAMLEQKQ